MDRIKSLLLLILGPSWRTSLLGYFGAALVEVASYLDALPNSTWKGWHIVAIFMLAFGRVAKDAAVSGAAKVVLAILLCTGLPALAQVDSTAGTVDGAGEAAAVANQAPDAFRFSTVLPLPGRPTLLPAVAITPFAVSLKDGALTTGLTVGAGYEILWNPTKATAFGVAAYASMRSTTDGPKPLVSVLGVFTPYLGLGVGYQMGGGATSFRDAAVVLISVGINLGAAPPAQ